MKEKIKTEPFTLNKLTGGVGVPDSQSMSIEDLEQLKKSVIEEQQEKVAKASTLADDNYRARLCMTALKVFQPMLAAVNHFADMSDEDKMVALQHIIRDCMSLTQYINTGLKKSGIETSHKKYTWMLRKVVADAAVNISKQYVTHKKTQLASLKASYGALFSVMNNEIMNPTDKHNDSLIAALIADNHEAYKDFLNVLASDDEYEETDEQTAIALSTLTGLSDLTVEMARFSFFTNESARQVHHQKAVKKIYEGAQRMYRTLLDHNMIIPDTKNRTALLQACIRDASQHYVFAYKKYAQLAISRIKAMENPDDVKHSKSAVALAGIPEEAIGAEFDKMIQIHCAGACSTVDPLRELMEAEGLSAKKSEHPVMRA